VSVVLWVWFAPDQATIGPPLRDFSQRALDNSYPFVCCPLRLRPNHAERRTLNAERLQGTSTNSAVRAFRLCTCFP
jgi:hypothetical protein